MDLVLKDRRFAKSSRRGFTVGIIERLYGQAFQAWRKLRAVTTCFRRRRSCWTCGTSDARTIHNCCDWRLRELHVKGIKIYPRVSHAAEAPGVSQLRWWVVLGTGSTRLTNVCSLPLKRAYFGNGCSMAFSLRYLGSAACCRVLPRVARRRAGVCAKGDGLPGGGPPLCCG